MKNRMIASNRSWRQWLAAVFAASAIGGSYASAAEDFFFFDDVPAPAPAPAKAAPQPQPAPAQPPRRAAVQLNVQRVEQIVVLPALYPNPLAFNSNWRIITAMDMRRAQMLAQQEAARARAALRRLQQMVMLPTIFPNPQAFTTNWFVFNTIEINRAQALAQARARAAAVPRRAPPNPGLEPQMRKMLEPVLKTELSFAARAARLNEAERNKLIAASKQWFDKFVPDLLKNIDPNQQQMFLQGVRGVWFGGQRQNQPANPRDTLRAGLAKVVEATIPNEKYIAYANECRKRDEFTRQASVENLVVRIDEKVKLSPEQWKKITRSLNDHWDKNRDPQLEAFVMSSSMWPGAPNQWVLPELTPAQQAVLKRVSSTSGQVWFGGGIMGGMFGGENAVIEDVDIDFQAEVVVEAVEVLAPVQEAE
jgi:hypothetical protein